MVSKYDYYNMSVNYASLNIFFWNILMYVYIFNNIEMQLSIHRFDAFLVINLYILFINAAIVFTILNLVLFIPYGCIYNQV